MTCGLLPHLEVSALPQLAWSKPPRTNGLSWILVAMMMASFGASSHAHARKPLQTGQSFPHFAFTDVDGKKANTQDFTKRIMIISVAGRNSSDRFMKWMRVAGLDALRKRPHLKFAYISIADVTSVPRLFKGVAQRAVRYINRSSNRELLQFYKENRLVPRNGAIVSHLIPDWDGQLMAKFGIKNADKYQCWIVVDGRVVAALPEGTDRIVQRYLETVFKADPARKALQPASVAPKPEGVFPAESRAQVTPVGTAQNIPGG